MSTLGQMELDNFYRSVQFDNPNLAMEIKDDVETVALYGLSADKSPAMPAVDRLRRAAFEMAEIHKRVLESALMELGF